MNAEVNELRDSARQVMEGAGLAAAEQETWPLVAELGWLMVTVPEEQGGLGMGLDAACALHLEMGRSLATVPCLSALLGIEALSGSDSALKETHLERVITGEEFIAVALAEPAVAVTRVDGDKLSGTLQAVPSADRADFILVATDDGELLALVARDAVQLTEQATWDKTRRLFDVALDGVAIDEQLVLARGGAARALLEKLAVHRDFALAADAVGGAAALLEMTVEYLKTRRQYGRPLALFQALKHRCADLKVYVEAAEALLMANLDLLAAGGDAVALASAAKELSAGTYTMVADESLQLHGGIGMTSEHDCHLFLKRAMLDEHLGRGQGAYSALLADQLLAATAR
ncbi:acyl-CoA dehydrogenase family protein [Haliea sp. E17]|uniref:acyl-CoA dehydrogenase family protein n=1 Tax=Haliea sp. E17 TaxID=3401576 RepID=UPI003AAD6AEA